MTPTTPETPATPPHPAYNAFGRVAYEAYCLASWPGVPRQHTLPAWSQCTAEERAPWLAAAGAVLGLVVRSLTTDQLAILRAALEHADEPPPAGADDEQPLTPPDPSYTAIGRYAYETYTAHVANETRLDHPLPGWELLTPARRVAWIAAGIAGYRAIRATPQTFRPADPDDF